MAEINDTPDGKPRASSLRILLFIAGMIAICVIVVFALGYKQAWEKMVRLDCGGNLRGISVLCREFAAQHDGHFPSTWFELNLIGEDANSAKLLRCPSTRHDTGIWSNVDLWSDYRLLPGRSTNNSPHTILALEPLSNHDSVGANVLFVDGSTQWWSAARLLESAVGIVTNNVVE